MKTSVNIGVFRKGLTKISDGYFNVKSSVQTMRGNSSGGLSVAGLLFLIVALVIGIKFLAVGIPQAYNDWGNATAAGGGLANASQSDKSLWNMGQFVLIGGALLILVMAVLGRRG